jgi:hypothetical protein
MANDGIIQACVDPSYPRSAEIQAGVGTLLSTNRQTLPQTLVDKAAKDPSGQLQAQVNGTLSCMADKVRDEGIDKRDRGLGLPEDTTDMEGNQQLLERAPNPKLEAEGEKLLKKSDQIQGAQIAFNRAVATAQVNKTR